MKTRVVLSLVLFGLPPFAFGQPPLSLVPRSFSGVSSAPVPSADPDSVSRFDLAESSPFAAITATDPRLQSNSPACQPGTANDISSPTLEPCTRSTPAAYARFVDSPEPVPLTGMEKARLAARNVIDPGSLATLAGGSAFGVLTNSHTAYGAGLGGFGHTFAVGLLQESTGQFFGTWAIPSLVHEDPRYHRMPHAGIPRRVAHALSHTLLSQHDDGRPMLNVATLATYPISAEISNLYVPGIHGNGRSTAVRVLTGYATDPVDNVLAEFLPDLARHLQVHLLFTQHLLNRLASDPSPALP